MSFSRHHLLPSPCHFLPRLCSSSLRDSLSSCETTGYAQPREILKGECPSSIFLHLAPMPQKCWLNLNDKLLVSSRSRVAFSSTISRVLWLSRVTSPPTALVSKHHPCLLRSTSQVSALSPPHPAPFHRKLGALLHGGSTPSALPVGGSGGPAARELFGRAAGTPSERARRAAGRLQEVFIGAWTPWLRANPGGTNMRGGGPGLRSGGWEWQAVGAGRQTSAPEGEEGRCSASAASAGRGAPASPTPAGWASPTPTVRPSWCPVLRHRPLTPLSDCH